MIASGLRPIPLPGRAAFANRRNALVASARRGGERSRHSGVRGVHGPALRSSGDFVRNHSTKGRTRRSQSDSRTSFWTTKTPSTHPQCALFAVAPAETQTQTPLMYAVMKHSPSGSLEGL